MRPDPEGDFREWVAASRTQLRRTAYLLTARRRKVRRAVTAGAGLAKPGWE